MEIFMCVYDSIMFYQIKMHKKKQPHGTLEKSEVFRDSHPY